MLQNEKYDSQIKSNVKVEVLDGTIMQLQFCEVKAIGIVPVFFAFLFVFLCAHFPFCPITLDYNVKQKYSRICLFQFSVIVFYSNVFHVPKVSP